MKPIPLHFFIIDNLSGYGSIPINTIFNGMNIHLPAILMFTRGTRFWHTAIFLYQASTILSWRRLVYFMQGDQLMVRGDYTGAYNAYTEVALGQGWKGCRWMGCGSFFLGPRDPGNHSWWWVSALNMLLYYIYLYIYLNIYIVIYIGFQSLRWLLNVEPSQMGIRDGGYAVLVRKQDHDRLISVI